MAPAPGTPDLSFVGEIAKVGVLGLILGWFMLRLEGILKELIASNDRKAKAVDDLAHEIRESRREVGEIAKEVTGRHQIPGRPGGEPR